MAWVLPALCALACGDVSSADAESANFGEGSDSGSGAAPPPSAGGAPDAPEREVESSYEAPVATGRFVWVANPRSGRVAYVDAVSLEVRTVEAGNGPTFLAAVPGQTQDTTLVINVVSEDATLLRATATGITATTLPIAAGANSLAFSADGRYAVAWTDARKVDAPQKVDGFQDLTVLDLEAGTSTVLAVGYRPVAIGFAANAPRAYAVTQDGVAVVDLAGAPRVLRNVAVADDPNEDPGSRDVSVTPDGQLALIRREGSAAIGVVSLESGARVSVTLPGPATDLDLNDVGDRAVAVIRSTSQVALLPVPGVATQPATFSTVDVPGETIGSVSLAAGGDKGLLYTNASAVERVTILDLAAAPPTFRTVRLYAPVLGVFASPNAAHAVVLHDRIGGTDPDAARSAFSLVPVASALPAKIVATSAPPTAVAVVDDRAIVAERDDARGVYGAYVARFPQLMVERFELASPPIAVGVVPAAKRAFVAQEHADGRLTFIDLETGTARTLTGFELSARVVDGSKP